MTDTTTTRQPATLAELLDTIEHRRLAIPAGDDGETLQLSVWADADDDGVDGRVVFLVDCEWGKPSRFVDLPPAKARELGRALIRTADEIDHLRGRVAADAVRADGGDAMTAAKAHIDATFAEA